MIRYFVAIATLFVLFAVGIHLYASRVDPVYIPTDDGLGMERGFRYHDQTMVAKYRDALASYEAGQLEVAERQYADIVAAAPDYTGARIALAAVQQHLNKLDSAKTGYLYVLRQNPGLEQAHAGLGSVELRLGNFQPAIVSLQKALELEPNYGVAHYLLAVCYTTTGETSKARAHFKTTIDLIPESMHAGLAETWLADYPAD